jgi:allantoinase
LVGLDSSFTLRAEDLFYRHKMSPYVGRAFRGKIVRTIVRGITVFQDGKIVSEPVGRFIEPGWQPAEVPSGKPDKTPQKGA